MTETQHVINEGMLLDWKNLHLLDQVEGMKNCQVTSYNVVIGLNPARPSLGVLMVQAESHTTTVGI